ncbi:MAG TPA: epoxide hydrolase N-terminal domain-containing protein, partial [Terriglobia bacterium]|nr:epoxide hydrolase N-terminal domain-containing protein [Terriglobia bacterium]
MTSEHPQHIASGRSTLVTAAGAALVCSLFIFSFAVAQTSSTGSAAEDRSIRAFKVQVPQAALDDLRRRINATRWPDRETVADRSQGTQLASLQNLVRYWGTDYDWRKVEAKLNALPQFITTI